MISKEFELELAKLLNKYSVDAFCSTPDFLLSALLVSVLNAQRELSTNQSGGSDG